MRATKNADLDTGINVSGGIASSFCATGYQKGSDLRAGSLHCGEISHLTWSENDVLADVAFAEPVLSDPDISRDFVRMHIALEGSSTRLERDERLAEWLCTLVEHFSTRRPPRARRTQRDERALLLACDYLGDRSERNVGLDELAAAGIGKFRLIRLFRDWTGLPPHALQVAHRIRVACRTLEANQTIAETAAATGFADQSHLHRHFVHGLRMTPAEYQRRFET